MKNSRWWENTAQLPFLEFVLGLEFAGVDPSKSSRLLFDAWWSCRLLLQNAVTEKERHCELDYLAVQVVEREIRKP